MNYQLISYPEIKAKYEHDTGKKWAIDGIPTIDYITWLEDKLLDKGIFKEE